MRYETKFILGSCLGLSILIGAIVYERGVKKSCNAKIVLDTGDTCYVRRINFYASGFADVQMCNGERAAMHTSSIDTIIDINK
jgi:hypothetical protein